MAIKISGNTVIDDSQNLCNVGTVTASCFFGDGSQLTGLPIPSEDVLKPSNLSPSNGEEDVNASCITLLGSSYISLFGCAHTCSCFQVSECSDFSTCNVFTCEIAGACTSLTVPAGCLNFGTQHFFRLRYEDENGCCSDFSDATCFTTISVSTLGESVFGGFYMGTICAAGSCYYLVMAPNATGCACCQWKTTVDDSGVGNELCDGYGNTYDHLTDATHPAGNWTATRSISGFDDWYLPARLELDQLYVNKASSPAGEGFVTQPYWSSTEGFVNSAQRIYFGNRGVANRFKTDSGRVRAIRRVAF